MSYAEIERSGISLAVSDLSVRYHAPARYENLIRVETTLTDLRSRLISFDYIISNAETGQRLATAQTRLVSLDRLGKPTAMPDNLRRIFF